MSKYAALGKFLAENKENRIDLTFSQVEEIIKFDLPSTAYQHGAWWANSRTKDSHTWAHIWISAGWKVSTHNLANQTVSFVRLSEGDVTQFDLLESLKPTSIEAIYDLLSYIGISNEDWHITSTGQTVENFKANPNFCYDWSFGSEDQGFAICVWHDELKLDGGRIIYLENIKAHANRLEKESRNSLIDRKHRSRAAQQAKRARSFDAAISASYRKGLPLSVILLSGDRVGNNEIGSATSKVKFRVLDTIKWYVHRYDIDSGDTCLVRGVPSEGAIGDEFDAITPDVIDEIQYRAIKTRRGQAAFRAALLAAYNRRCAVTGCKIVELLEAAHITPHSEDGGYSTQNGLLLRADIHTLYDLNLLSIDDRLVVHLAPEIDFSQYTLYNKKLLSFNAELPSDAPSPSLLSARHQKFLKLHGFDKNAQDTSD
jgi:hypothetical protein